MECKIQKQADAIKTFTELNNLDLYIMSYERDLETMMECYVKRQVQEDVKFLRMVYEVAKHRLLKGE